MDPRDLYGLPLDRFVPERTALAREFRRRGERSQADAVAKLRKPSLAAWAVNQLVRTQRRAVADLFAAGDATQDAQADLLSGRGDANALREALAHERRVVVELVEVARGLLTSSGHELGPSVLERVADTLHAAALEAEARAQVEDGCLDRELRHVGLGPAGLSPTSPSGSGPRGESRRRPAAATEKLRELRKAEAETGRAAERATRELEAAEQRRQAAAEALREAETALADAESRAREARAAHRKAERALESQQ